MKYCIVYTLEVRKKQYKNKMIPNLVESVIGVFSTQKKAYNWIKKNGKTYYPDHDNIFFAVLKNVVDKDDFYLMDFVDVEGTLITNF